jgi:glycerol-3-phosphate dehydrogenase (NAD(P)+)
MNNTMTFGILGSGSWATAIAKIICEQNNPLFWYLRNENTITHLKQKGTNPNYLQNVSFNPNQLKLSSNIREIVKQADILILAIPSPFIHQNLQEVKDLLPSKIVFSAVKGIIPESKDVVCKHLEHSFGVPKDHIGVIMGPCHAEEVALEKLSFLTLASQNRDTANYLAQQMTCSYIRTKVTDDIIGVEYAGTLKNIYALAVGIAHGLGYGDNFQSVLMSNSIRELKRFLKQIHKTKRDMSHSAYLGDLLVTGYSLFSRNRMLGTMIGKGYTVNSALNEMTMISEGYYASHTVKLLIQEIDKSFPIMEAVCQILHEKKSAKKVMAKVAEGLH